MPFLVQGLLLCYWSWILGVLFSAPEPSGRAFNLGGCTLSGGGCSYSSLFPKCFMQVLSPEMVWREGTWQHCPSLVSLWSLGGSPGALPRGEGEPFGVQLGSRVSVGWSRRSCPRVLWSRSGVPQCFAWNSGPSLPSCPCGSHCSNLVSLPTGPRSPPVGSLS